MKAIIGILLILGGIVLGIYVGFWVCLVGGIVQIIETIRADTLVAMDVAFGIGRVICCSLFGYISAFVLILPGVACLEDF